MNNRSKGIEILILILAQIVNIVCFAVFYATFRYSLNVSEIWAVGASIVVTLTTVDR
jgi:hypothetical protein